MKILPVLERDKWKAEESSYFRWLKSSDNTVEKSRQAKWPKERGMEAEDD